MPSRSRPTALSLALGLILGPLGALAQSAGADTAATPAKPQGRPSGMAVYRVCKPDIKLYCPHMSLGGAKQKQCMKENFEKLSPDCQAISKRYEAQPPK